eukprot:13246629-Alexandrium_andersonii.AAC.1
MPRVPAMRSIRRPGTSPCKGLRPVAGAAAARASGPSGPLGPAALCGLLSRELTSRRSPSLSTKRP